MSVRKKRARKKKKKKSSSKKKKASSKKASSWKTVYSSTTASKKKARKPAKKRAKRTARTARIGAAAFSGDGRVLAIASGKTIGLWDVSGKRAKKLGNVRTLVDASRVALDRTGSLVAAAVAGFSEVRVRSATGATRGALLNEVRARGAVTCFAFAPDGRFVVGEVERIGEKGVHARSFITVVDLPSGDELFRAPVADLPIREIAFSTDGLLVFLGFGGGVVVVFDLEAQRELFRFPSGLDEHAIGARIAAAFGFSADGRRAAIGYDNTVEVWSIDGGERLTTIDLGAKAWSLALSNDGVIAGAPASGVWSLSSGKKTASLDVAHPVIASPDGKQVVLGERVAAKGPKLAAIRADGGASF